MKDEFNPYLPYNERIRDFIRWKELGFIIVLFVFFYIIFGWFGIILAPFFHYLMATMEGGAVGDIDNEYPAEEYPPNICSAGIEGCKICDNEYEHTFNETYQNSLKWWDKML